MNNAFAIVSLFLVLIFTSCSEFQTTQNHKLYLSIENDGPESLENIKNKERGNNLTKSGSLMADRNSFFWIRLNAGRAFSDDQKVVLRTNNGTFHDYFDHDQSKGFDSIVAYPSGQNKGSKDYYCLFRSGTSLANANITAHVNKKTAGPITIEHTASCPSNIRFELNSSSINRVSGNGKGDTILLELLIEKQLGEVSQGLLFKPEIIDVDGVGMKLYDTRFLQTSANGSLFVKISAEDVIAAVTEAKVKIKLVDVYGDCKGLELETTNEMLIEFL